MSRRRRRLQQLLEGSESFQLLEPDAIQLLVDLFANESPVLGKLSWGWRPKLSHDALGEYSPHLLTLFLSVDRRRGLFRGQAWTILHEIQHWNQHARFVERHRLPWEEIEDLTEKFLIAYNIGERQKDNPYERDAENFAGKNVDKAIAIVNSKVYQKKVEGGTFQDALDELIDASSEGRLTMRQVGEALRDYGMNNMERVRAAVQALAQLGISVR